MTMIFSLKHGMYTAVLLGEKTLTSRLRLARGTRVGQRAAIVPGRTKAAWLLGTKDGQIIPHLGDWAATQYPALADAVRAAGLRYVADYVKAQGYLRACIHIEGFWETPVQQMTEAEAREEGFSSVDAFASVWDSLNDGRGIRWRDNPTIWRERFSVPLDVAQAVSRIGRQTILDVAAQQLGARTA